MILFDLFPPLPREEWKSYLLNEEESAEPIWKALESLGHQVRAFGISDSIDPLLLELKNSPPDRVFNLCEALYNERSFEGDVPSLLELFMIRYTGAKPATLHLTKNKVISKLTVKGAGITVPEFVLHPFHSNKNLTPLNQPFPHIVKPVSGEASEGISSDSIVRSNKSWTKRVSDLQNHLSCDVMTEEFIEGPEMSVGLIGKANALTAFPPRELVLGDGPPLATFQGKWDDKFRKLHGIQHRPHQLSKKEAVQLQKLAIHSGHALGLTGYGRIDFRISPSGVPYFLEANANPSLSPEDEFALGALDSGLEYSRLIQKILSLS